MTFYESNMIRSCFLEISMRVKVAVSWNIAHCSLIEIGRRFRGYYRFMGQ
jgi:hypothetical protein